MSLNTTLTAVRNKMLSSVPGMTGNNCKIADESFFAYIQNNPSDGAAGCLIDYGGLSDSGQRSEFRSTIVRWSILINGFFMLLNQDSTQTPLTAARTFVDNVLSAFSSDPTIGGTVTGVKVVSGTPPLTYRRGNYNYILVAITISAVENIS